MKSASPKPHAPYVVSITYDVTTPESAEQGDFAETGFEREPAPMTLRETVQALDNYGGIYVQTHPHGLASYAEDGVENYRTGENTRYAVHVKGSTRAMFILEKILRKRGFRVQ